MAATNPPDAPPRNGLAPLYAAGFTTAFGAHGVAAALGVESGELGVGLLGFGLMLAVYDLAEVVLKPGFGALRDRVGVRPVIIGGLLAFAAASAVGVFAAGAVGLTLARFGQGMAAAAFSPAASAGVARIGGGATTGRRFGRYGSWKGLGYAFGPILGAALVWAGGLPALYAALAVLALAVAGWVVAAVPPLRVLPRSRATVLDLAREVAQRSFLAPVAAMAVATGALGVGVGFLPLLGTRLGLGEFGAVAAVTVLALTLTAVQPWAGARRDAGRLATGTGMIIGLALVAAGLVVVAVPLPTVAAAIALYLAAVLLGIGIGVVTPLGFAAIAAATPEDRMGRTMGSAELGRELGDAGGPLLVGGLAAVSTVGVGLAALAGLALAVGAGAKVALRG